GRPAGGCRRAGCVPPVGCRRLRQRAELRARRRHDEEDDLRLAGRPRLQQRRAQLVDLAVQLLDRELGLYVHPEILVGLQPVLRSLAVLAHHDDRRLQRGEAREQQVEEDVRIGIGRRLKPARAVAVRAARSNTASSPKNEPDSNVATMISPPCAGSTMSTMPCSTTYRYSGSSPWSKIVSPPR